MAIGPIILRIDDRLIHGQVVVGWGSHYPIKKLVIGNTDIAENEWERELLSMAVPSHLHAEVLTISQTRDFIQLQQSASDLSMVLVESPRDIKALADPEFPVRRINVGGIHHQEGRRKFLPYLYLNQAEVEIFKELMQRGFVFECQDVPTGHKYDLAKILEKRS